MLVLALLNTACTWLQLVLKDPYVVHLYVIYHNSIIPIQRAIGNFVILSNIMKTKGKYYIESSKLSPSYYFHTLDSELNLC